MAEEGISENLAGVNPVKLLNFIDKYVTVKLIKNCTYTGFVNSIDPVSGSVILLTPKGEVYQTILIPGHAIQQMIPAVPDTNLTPPTRRVIPELSPEEISRRKCRLARWLRKNLLPVDEGDGIMKVAGISISEPYSVMDIQTDNSVVYNNIKKLLEGIPDDFDAEVV